MNRFKLLFIFFPIILISLRLYADEIVNESKLEKKIYIGFSFSPSYCWNNIELSGRASLFNEYIYPTVLYNFNSKLIFNKILGSDVNLRTGISQINYSVKAGHIPVWVGQDPFTHEEFYDSIDIKSTSHCISLPIGINMCIINKKNILEIEAGIFNNIQLDVTYKPINWHGDHHPTPINPWLLGTKTYYLSIYFQLNYIVSINKFMLELSPIFNFTPNNISFSDVDEYIKFYQIGLDIGFRF